MSDLFATSSRLKSPSSSFTAGGLPSVENLGYSESSDGMYQIPGPSHLDNTTNPPIQRRWSIKDFSLPKLSKGTGDSVSSRIPILDENVEQKTTVPSQFVQTDDSLLEKDDTFLWEYEEPIYSAVIFVLKESYIANKNELYSFVLRNDHVYPFEDRIGAHNWAVKVRGDENTPDEPFAGVISWTQLNMAQINYDINEEGFRDSDIGKSVGQFKSNQSLKYRLKAAIYPLRKGQIAEGIMTILGKENKIFDSKYHEYVQKEEDALQKALGKKNEEFYLLKFAAVRPDYKDPKYKIEDMLLTWFCNTADVAKVSCVHILAEPSLMPLFKKFGFVGMGSNDVVRLRDRTTKLNLPLLYRPRTASVRTFRPTGLIVVDPNLQLAEVPLAQNLQSVKESCLRSPSKIDLSLKENDSPEASMTQESIKDVKVSARPDVKAVKNIKPAASIPVEIPLLEPKFQGTPARPLEHQTGDLREIPSTRGSLRIRAPSNASDIKWQSPTRFLHEQSEEIIEEKNPKERIVSRIPSLRRANSKGSQRTIRSSKLKPINTLTGYVWRDSKPGVKAILAENQKPVKKALKSIASSKHGRRKSVGGNRPDHIRSSDSAPTSRIIRSHSARSSPKISADSGLNKASRKEEINDLRSCIESLPPNASPPFPLRRKGTRIRVSSLDKSKHSFATHSSRSPISLPPPETAPTAALSMSCDTHASIGEVALFVDSFEPVDFEEEDGYEGEGESSHEDPDTRDNLAGKNINTEEGVVLIYDGGSDKSKQTDKAKNEDVDADKKEQEDTSGNTSKPEHKQTSPQLLADEAFLREISSTLCLVHMDGPVDEVKSVKETEMVIPSGGLEKPDEANEHSEKNKKTHVINKQDGDENKERIKKIVTFKEPVGLVVTG